MRVALVSSGLVPLPPIKGGAVEEYVYQLSRHLRKLGVDAVAIDAKWNGIDVETDNQNGAAILRILVRPPPLNIKGNIATEFQFGKTASKYLNKEDFDVVHANTAWAGFALAVNRERSRNFVYTCHNPL